MDEMASPGAAVPPLAGTTPYFTHLAQDVTVLVLAFLPLVDLLALSAASKHVHEMVAHPQHWLHLGARCGLLRAMPSRESDGRNAVSSSAAGGKAGAYARTTFLQHAEAEMNWRRGRPVGIRQERLVLTEKDDGMAPLQSLVLWKEEEHGRRVLLAARGTHVGVYRGDEDGRLSVSHRGPDLCFQAHADDSRLHAMKAAADAPTLVTAGMDHTVKVFEWTTGREQAVLAHHTSAVWGLDVDGGGAGAPLMVASSDFCHVALFDAGRQREPVASFRAHGSWVRTLHLDVGRHLLVSGSADASCKTWDLRRLGQLLTKYVHPNHFEEVRSVACVQDRLFTACYDGKVREYELMTGHLCQVLADHGPYPVECVHLDRDTGRLVSADWSGMLACATGPPLVDVRPDLPHKEDVATLVHGPSEEDLGSPTGSAPSFFSPPSLPHYRLCPRYDDGDGDRRRVTGYSYLRPRDDLVECLEATLSSTVCALQHDDDCLVMGTKHGDLVSLSFREGV